MKIFLLILFILIAIVVEGTFIALPFFLVSLVVLQIRYSSEWIILCAFLGGFFLDMMLFRQIGSTSLYLLSLLFIISLYERRFEVKTMLFALSSVMLGTAGYLLLFGSRAFIWQICITVFFSLLLFLFFHTNNSRDNRLMKS